jgi:hypothetical protein
MQIKLNQLDRLVLEYEPGQASAADAEDEIQRFLRDRVLSAKPAHHASLFLIDKPNSTSAIFSEMALPGDDHGDYPAWAKAAGHSFETDVTARSFDRIVRRLVEVASASGYGQGKMRISSNDLKSLFTNWMDTTL